MPAGVIDVSNCQAGLAETQDPSRQAVLRHCAGAASRWNLVRCWARFWTTNQKGNTMVETTILVVAGKNLPMPRLFKRVLQVAIAVALTAGVFCHDCWQWLSARPRHILSGRLERLAYLHQAPRHPHNHGAHRIRDRALCLLAAKSRAQSWRSKPAFGSCLSLIYRRLTARTSPVRSIRRGRRRASPSAESAVLTSS